MVVPIRKTYLDDDIFKYLQTGNRLKANIYTPKLGEANGKENTWNLIMQIN